LALPWSTKILIDDVIARRRVELLLPLGSGSPSPRCFRPPPRTRSHTSSGRLLSVRSARCEPRCSPTLRGCPRVPGLHSSARMLSRIMNDPRAPRVYGVTRSSDHRCMPYRPARRRGPVHAHARSRCDTRTDGDHAIGLAALMARLRPLFREPQPSPIEVSGGSSIVGRRLVSSRSLLPTEGAAGQSRSASTVVPHSIASAPRRQPSQCVGCSSPSGSAQRCSHRRPRGRIRRHDVGLIRHVPLVHCPVAGVLAPCGGVQPDSCGGRRLERIHVLRNAAREDRATRAAHRRGVRGDIQIVAGRFRVHARVPVLSSISFHMPVGTTTALVGRAGPERRLSTNLLLTYYRPTKADPGGRPHLADVRQADYRSISQRVPSPTSSSTAPSPRTSRFFDLAQVHAELQAAARDAGCAHSSGDAPRVSTTLVANAVSGSRAGNGSSSRSRGLSSRTRASGARRGDSQLDGNGRPRFGWRCSRRAGDERHWSSPTGCRRCEVRTRSSCWRRAHRGARNPRGADQAGRSLPRDPRPPDARRT